jgi:hypothetical protein
MKGDATAKIPTESEVKAAYLNRNPIVMKYIQSMAKHLTTEPSHKSDYEYTILHLFC